ncbi:hypothetical protein AA0311_1580 [Asaia bogorensis NBRC 16594]|uniref:Uncharacterized protein n=1 Tax=Asaia bogorensis NBRC 16594 TaxID=1231624 RepID=A0AAN4U447_9PROT|nr:hypothetical protein AA0311_1580 [Asaia bogorensis NBRC 16594]GEL54430.1 hypothetical protein ABO01nite_24370 [Asaia bogorensis NBRC 16594]
MYLPGKASAAMQRAERALPFKRGIQAMRAHDSCQLRIRGTPPITGITDASICLRSMVFLLGVVGCVSGPDVKMHRLGQGTCGDQEGLALEI